MEPDRLRSPNLPATPQTLIVVMDEASGRILGAQFVPKEKAEHEFNRLIDHFQFGASDWDILSPVFQTFAIRLQPSPSNVRPASDHQATIQAPSYSRFLP